MPEEADEPPLADETALAALERRPATLVHAMASAVVWLGGREAPKPTAAHPLVIRQAAALGFRYLGLKREGLTPIGIVADAWVAPDATAYLTGKQARSRDPIVRGMSLYLILTYFDDGTCVETYASKDAIGEESGSIVSLRGTDSLANDWPAHRAAVARHCAQRGCRVIPVRDMATVQRLTRVYFRQLMSASTAKLLLGMFVVMSAAFFGVLALVLKLILR